MHLPIERAVSMRAPESESSVSSSLSPGIQASSRSNGRLMPREALLKKFAPAQQRRCVVVQGPAGSGKSSTLRTWRQTLIGLEFDVASLTLCPEDNDLERFALRLQTCLDEVDPLIAKEAALIGVNERGVAAVERWIISLVSAIANRSRDLALFVDDLHHIGRPSVVEALQLLLDYAPPRLCFAFASRRALPVSLSRLQAQNLVLELGPHDLAFSAAETERYLNDHVGPVDYRDAQKLHDLTGGWVAGLQLLATNLKAQPGKPLAVAHMRDAQAFTQFLETEVLAQLPADTLDLLTRMAVCEKLNASLCATVTGHPRAIARMMALLARLDAEGLFVTQVATVDGSTWYRLHPLIHEALRARLMTLPEAERRALHESAWRWFEQHGQPALAVHHAVKAGDVSAAADLVEACVNELLALGELAQVHDLMRILPPAAVDARFNLRIVTGHMQIREGDYASVEAILADMGEAFAQGSLNARERLVFALLRCALAMQRDEDIEAIAPLLPTLLAAPEDADEVTWATRAIVLAWVYTNQGRYAEARQVIDDNPARDGAPRSRLIGRCLAGDSHVLQGEIAVAERIFREVLHEADRQGNRFADAACMASIQLADALFEQNHVEAAYLLLEPRMEVIERIALPDIVLRALLRVASAHMVAQRNLEALAAVERLESYAQRRDMERPEAYALLGLVRLSLRLGEIDRADAALVRVAAIGARHAGRTSGRSFEIRLCAQRAQIDIDLHRNDVDRACQRLEQVAAQCEAAGRWRRVAGVRMLLADAAQRSGRAALARENLIESLRLGHRLCLVRTLLDASPDVPRMIRAFADDATFDPVLAFYVQRLLFAAEQTSGHFVPACAAGAADAFASLSDRERDVLELVAQTMQNKKIARVLGITPETVKWHMKNIFTKLGVNSRDEAAACLRVLQPGSAGARVPPGD